MAASILIEGPDGSGKTYLAERLIENLKASYIHGKKVPKANLDRVCERMIEALTMLKENNFNVITDRFIYSQPIYEQIFENDDRNNKNHLLEWYRDHFDYQIICLPRNREKYLNEFNRLKSEREEEYNVMSDVYDAYRALFFGKKFSDSKDVHEFIKNKLFLDIVDYNPLETNSNCFLYDRFTSRLENNKGIYTIDEFCEIVNAQEKTSKKN